MSNKSFEEYKLLNSQTFEECETFVTMYSHHMKHSEKIISCELCCIQYNDEKMIINSFLEISKKLMIYQCLFPNFDFENKLLRLFYEKEFQNSKYKNNCKFQNDCEIIQYFGSQRLREISIDNILKGVVPIIDYQQYHNDIIIVLESSIQNNRLDIFINECSKIKNIRYCDDSILKLTYHSRTKYDLDYTQWVGFIKYVVQLSPLYKLIKMDEIITDFEILY